MNVNVIQQVKRIVKPVIGGKTVVISQSGYGNNIPATIGEAKGDLIAFRGRGDPVRLQAGNIAGRILVTDPSSPTGWSVVPNSGSSGSTVSLHNSLNTIVPGGTIVKISQNYDFVKATSADTSMLFITAEDCDPDEDVTCYGVANTICSILCDEGAVDINDQLEVSSTAGLAKATVENGFAVALSSKAQGITGIVDAIIVQNGFLPLEGGTLTGDLEVLGDIDVSGQIDVTGDLNTDGDAKFSGNVSLVSTTIKAKSSQINEDNTPSSVKSYAPFEWYDKDGNLIGHIELKQDTSNNLFVNIGIRRLIDGVWTWNQKTFSVSSDGKTSENTDGIENQTDIFPSELSIPNNTERSVANFTLDPGLYIITISLAFVQNSTGYRRLFVSDDSTGSTNLGFITMATMRAVADARSVLAKTFTMDVESTTTYYVFAQQNSGGSLSLSPRVRIARIR